MTFQEISDALEDSNTLFLSPLAREVYENLIGSYATDEQFETEAEAIEQLISDALSDQDDLENLLQAAQANMRWIVIVRLDGAETIVLSREVRATNKEEAGAEFLTGLRAASPDGEFRLEYIYGPY